MEKEYGARPPRGEKKLRYIALGMVMGLVLSGMAWAAAFIFRPPPAAQGGEHPLPSPSVESPAPTPAADARKTIYVLLARGNPYWDNVLSGALKAEEDLGCSVIVSTATIPQIGDQVDALQDAAAAGADAIVIVPMDRKALALPISEVFLSGIPVVLVDSLIDAEDYSAAYLTDNYAAGEIAAKTLYDLIKAAGTDETQEGVIAVSLGSTGSQAIIDRDDGFKTWWDANAPKNWEVQWDEVKTSDPEPTVFAIAETPNLIGLFAPSDGATAKFAKELEESGRTDIAIVGFDFSSEIQSIIRSKGFHAATVVQRPYYMGYDSVAKALELANGGTVTQKHIDTGVLVIDRENIDSAEVSKAAGVN